MNWLLSHQLVKQEEEELREKRKKEEEREEREGKRRKESQNGVRKQMNVSSEQPLNLFGSRHALKFGRSGKSVEKPKNLSDGKFWNR